MAIKSFKPYSAGRRFMTVSAFDEITASKPEKSLLAKISQKGGRNNTGKMTVRHQGGGHKRQYRIIDFKRILLDGDALGGGTEKAVHVVLHRLDGQGNWRSAPQGRTGTKRFCSRS